MALIATLEGLAEVPGDLCAHGRPAKFCTLCARSGVVGRPDRGDSFEMRRRPPAAPPRPRALAELSVVAPRPLSTHEKWSIGIGIAGLALSIATTIALLRRIR